MYFIIIFLQIVKWDISGSYCLIGDCNGFLSIYNKEGQLISSTNIQKDSPIIDITQICFNNELITIILTNNHIYHMYGIDNINNPPFKIVSYNIENEFNITKSMKIFTNKKEIVYIICGEGEYQLALYVFNNQIFDYYNGIKNDNSNKLISYDYNNNKLYLLYDNNVLYLYDIYTLLYLHEWKYIYYLIQNKFFII